MTAGTRVLCPACGHRADGVDEFCEACGWRLSPAPVSATESSDRTEFDQGVAAAVSDRGLVHTRNEDAFFLHVTAGRTIAVVCDGVSSSTAPHLAARMGAAAAGTALQSTTPADPTEAMQLAITAARRAVATIAWAPVRGHAAPSSTIIAALCEGGRATIATLGDSRAYWIDHDDALRLTRDDSWAEEQVAAGAVDVHDAAQDARAHMITAWLGADAPVHEPRVEAFTPPRPGRLIICSDGLWNGWPGADELAGLVREASPAASPLELARLLTARAIAGGGRDNITVVVIDMEPSNVGAREIP
jgi:serine/threonine protein phosphatase PrpC